MDNRRFYTYAWLREDGTPYYIGKGSGGRAWRQSGRRSKAKMPPRERVLILKKNLTEEEAFRHEIYMIAIYGRKDLGTGILHNFSDGGEGLSCPSPEVIEKIRESRKGYKHSPETRAKLSEAAKGRRRPTEEENKRNSERNTGAGNARFGVTVSEETRRKISESNRGKTHTEETKEKMSIAQKKAWENRPRTKSEETRERMRQGWIKRKEKQQRR